MSASNTPCAACKLLRRKCTQECVFAPYFPPDQTQKFVNVHKVFGASNVGKILNELPTSQREAAATSLAYEAEARLRDPIYGSVGLISVLQQRLKQVDQDLFYAKKELANYIGPAAMLPTHQLQQFGQPQPINPLQVQTKGLQVGQPPGGGQLVVGDQQQQQMMMGTQPLVNVAAARQRLEMQMAYQQQLAQQLAWQQQAQQLAMQQAQQQADEQLRLNQGFDAAGQVVGSDYNQMAMGGSDVSPALAFGAAHNQIPSQVIQQQPLDHQYHQFQPQDHYVNQFQQQNRHAHRRFQPQDHHVNQFQQQNHDAHRRFQPQDHHAHQFQPEDHHAHQFQPQYHDHHAHQFLPQDHDHDDHSHHQYHHQMQLHDDQGQFFHQIQPHDDHHDDRHHYQFLAHDQAQLQQEIQPQDHDPHQIQTQLLFEQQLLDPQQHELSLGQLLMAPDDPSQQEQVAGSEEDRNLGAFI